MSEEGFEVHSPHEHALEHPGESGGHGHGSSNTNQIAMSIEVAPGKKEFYQGEIERYKTEKADIKKKADALEAESADWDHRSDEEMHQHHRWAQATTVLQISIALAAIALLTRKDWLKRAIYVVSSLGIVIGILAAFHI